MTNSKRKITENIDDDQSLTIISGSKIHDLIIEIALRLGSLNKRLDVLEASIDNITQQYHRFAIAYENTRPMFEKLQKDFDIVLKKKKIPQITINKKKRKRYAK